MLRIPVLNDFLQLDGAHLEVTSVSDIEKTPSILPASATGSTPIGATEGDLAQEDKPKAAIVAEYLAHGYALGDHIVQKAIDLDRMWSPFALLTECLMLGLSR